MIEETIVSYLTDAFETDNVPVYYGEPDPKANDVFWIRVEKTGMSMVNQIYSSTFAVQSYAPTFLGAAALSNAVVVAMLNITTEPEIAGVYLNAEYNYTDTATKQPRYQAVFNVVHY